MTAPAIFSAPVRKGRVLREVRDTCEVLFANVLEVVRKFNKEADKIRFTKAGQSVANLESGDTQPNRRAMNFILKNARQLVAKETAQAESKALALAQYEALIAPVVDGWKAVNEAWMKYVQAENKKGHKGQLAISQGIRFLPGLWTKFAQMEAKVKAVRGNEELVAALATELTDLEEEVRNFFVPNWCKHEGCGAPIEATKLPKGGGNPFPIYFCHEHVSDKDIKPTGKKSGKSKLEIRAEPLSAEEVEANRVAARALNEANLLAKKNRRRANAEASAGKSQKHQDGAMKSIRKHEKEEREQGGHPGAKGKGKKGGATKKKASPEAK